MTCVLPICHDYVMHLKFCQKSAFSLRRTAGSNSMTRATRTRPFMSQPVEECEKTGTPTGLLAAVTWCVGDCIYIVVFFSNAFWKSALCWVRFELSENPQAMFRLQGTFDDSNPYLPSAVGLLHPAAVGLSSNDARWVAISMDARLVVISTDARLVAIAQLAFRYS